MSLVRWCAIRLALAAFLAVAVAVPGTARADVATGCAPLTEVEGRWGSDQWQALNEHGDAPSGRGSRDRLEVRGKLPARLAASPALAVAVPDGLVGYSVGGEARSWSRHVSFALPLRDDDAGKEVVLTFEARRRLMPGLTCTTSYGEAVAHPLHADLPQFVVGAVLVILGAILLAATALRRERTPEYLWLGVFALPLGVLSIAQATAYQMLLGLPVWFWYVCHYTLIFVHPIGLAQYVRCMFGDTRRRMLHWLSIALAVALALGIVLDVADVTRLASSRRITYPLLIAIGVITVLRARAHRASPEARLFLAGFALLFAFAIPDVAWGMGYPIIRVNFAQYGVLVFALTLASIIELRFRTQRKELEASMRTAEERADALAQNKLALESMNEELRHQVEARSRELVLALSSDRGNTAVSVPPRALRAQDVVGGRYSIVKELGAGAMGAVYLVERRTDGKRFALKTALGTITPEGAARMAREAEIAAKIRSEHLVSVIDVGLETGTPFLVMEYVEGCTLAERRERYGDVDWALPLLRQIALGLDALHGHGIIHRDLKPANVLLAKGADGREHVKISDFGIARFGKDDTDDAVSAFASTLSNVGGGSPLSSAELDAKLTATGALLGTPLYMAPEAAASGGRVTVASDVFAFGIVAHELLTGAYPYTRPPSISALAGLSIEPVAMADAERIPVEVSTIVMRALSLSPGARPSAKELAKAFGTP